jgi:hypothetical protein
MLIVASQHTRSDLQSSQQRGVALRGSLEPDGFTIAGGGRPCVPAELEREIAWPRGSTERT